MANKIVSYQFGTNTVRTLVDEQGNPWFVAKDVCDVLEHSNSRVALERLDEDEKGVSNVYTPGGTQSMTTINESGLYSLILTSRKPEAKRFKKWVTSEVIPTIRKTGSYSVEQQKPKLPEPPTMEVLDSFNKTMLEIKNSGDVQYAQLLKVYAANQLLAATQPALPGTSEVQKYEAVIEVALRLGYRVPKNFEASLGAFVKKQCGHLAISEKDQRFSSTSGRMVPATMYPANHPEVEAAVRAYCTMKAFQNSNTNLDLID